MTSIQNDYALLAFKPSVLLDTPDCYLEYIVIDEPHDGIKLPCKITITGSRSSFYAKEENP